jgi:hypothetical protein
MERTLWKWMAGGALVCMAAFAFARDVNIPNDSPTGSSGQGDRRVDISNDDGKIEIHAQSPTDKDTSIHIWWYVYTPGPNGEVPATGGENGKEKEKDKRHKRKTELKAEIPTQGLDGQKLHWVVAYDKWNKATAEDEWTWGTQGTMDL